MLLHISTGEALASHGENKKIDIQVNQTILKVDESPYIENGRTLVPLRNVAEALKGEVNWDGEQQKITIQKENLIIEMQISSNTVRVNDQSIKLDTAPSITRGRTFVPVRFVAEAFEYDVNWDPKNQLVRIIDSNQHPMHHTDEDLYWLSRIIEAEATGETYEGKLAVGNVILNRIKSKDFPHSIKEVIFDKSYGKFQFTPVSNGRIYNIPSQDSKQAALDVLQGKNNIGEALFFLNPSTATSSWIQQNRMFIKLIGRHAFYL